MCIDSPHLVPSSDGCGVCCCHNGKHDLCALELLSFGGKVQTATGTNFPETINQNYTNTTGKEGRDILSLSLSFPGVLVL